MLPKWPIEWMNHNTHCKTRTKYNAYRGDRSVVKAFCIFLVGDENTIRAELYRNSIDLNKNLKEIKAFIEVLAICHVPFSKNFASQKC